MFFTFSFNISILHFPFFLLFSFPLPVSHYQSSCVLIVMCSLFVLRSSICLTYLTTRTTSSGLKKLGLRSSLQIDRQIDRQIQTGTTRTTFSGLKKLVLRFSLYIQVQYYSMQKQKHNNSVKMPIGHLIEGEYVVWRNQTARIEATFEWLHVDKVMIFGQVEYLSRGHAQSHPNPVLSLTDKYCYIN